MTPIDILLVEDNPGDVLLTRDALDQSSSEHHLRVAIDGEEAVAQLWRDFGNGTLPDLIVLDVQLPGMSGHDVLAVIKAAASLRGLPVVMLSGSNSEADVRQSYDGHASCYVTKPRTLDDYTGAIQSIEAFWSNTVRLPRRAA